MDHDMSHYAAWQHIGHFLFGDQLFLLDMIIYILFVASFNLSNFYSLAQQKELETAKLNEQLSRTKLHALKMQVNPHFLFNTLNVIQVLVMKQETQKAAETLRRLSSFLRQTLDETDSQWVPLKSELDMVEQYLSIEQVRFGERLSVVCDFDQELMSTKVPAMLLQPLVENAMRHGLGEKQSDGTLWISTRKVAGNLMIKIQDDGVGCEPQKVLKDGKGIGLSNVMQRLSQLYGQQHVFDIESQPGKGCTIVIELPMKSGPRT
jgi:LytS/YehU family sensor histidine kinase